eukprot:gene772-957_t
MKATKIRTYYSRLFMKYPLINHAFWFSNIRSMSYEWDDNFPFLTDSLSQLILSGRLEHLKIAAVHENTFSTPDFQRFIENVVDLNPSNNNNNNIVDQYTENSSSSSSRELLEDIFKQLHLLVMNRQPSQHQTSSSSSNNNNSEEIEYQLPNSLKSLTVNSEFQPAFISFFTKNIGLLNLQLLDITLNIDGDQNPEFYKKFAQFIESSKQLIVFKFKYGRHSSGNKKIPQIIDDIIQLTGPLSMNSYAISSNSDTSDDGISKTATSTITNNNNNNTINNVHKQQTTPLKKRIASKDGLTDLMMDEDDEDFYLDESYEDFEYSEEDYEDLDGASKVNPSSPTSSHVSPTSTSAASSGGASSPISFQSDDELSSSFGTCVPGGTSASDRKGRRVPLLNLFQKFLNQEAIRKLQQRHTSINNRLERLKKVVDPTKLRERGQKLNQEKEKIKELIKLKKKQLNDHLNAPPFIRLMDKCAFTLGLIVLCISEFVLTRSPQLMYLWYSILIFPVREQVTPSLFKLVFSLSNGPLAWGTIVWRNSLVFHDVDKLTSVFIHLCPPIVTYCLRWYPHRYPEALACGGVECVLTLKEAYLIPICLYIFWQIFYYLKTEVVDSSKLANDAEIMTSSRWMSVKQPHPLYRLCLKYRINLSPVIILMVVQLAYTLLTLLTLPLIISSFWVHTGFLIMIFVCVTWNGACYYFEVFSASYNKRFQTDLSSDSGSKSPRNRNKLKATSVFAFFKFLGIFFVALFLYLKLIL